jgi:hypothetical protein
LIFTNDMKYTTLTKMADSVMYEASDEQLDHPAVAGGVSVWGGSKISNPRPGCKIRDGGPGSHSIPGINAVRTSFESPWQNGVAERWVGSCRIELLDRVIVLNERHLKRLLSEYVSYHREDRTHLGLGKGTPGCRTRCETSGGVLSHDRLGGLHHRYDRAV